MAPPLTRFGRDWVDLLEWLSMRTFQSAATVAKAWLRLLPKRLEAWETRPPRHRNAGLETSWTERPDAALLEAARNGTGRRLVLVPLAQQATRLAEALGCPALLADDPKTVATETWKTFLAENEGCLVTTRLGAWLGLFADRVLLLEPENDEHKQDELSPRFDARLVAAWLFQRKQVPLATFGRTPPIHVDAPAPTLDVRPILCIRHAQGRSAVPRIGVDALDRLTAFIEEEGRPGVVIHPIRGWRARSQCRTCGLVVACAACGSALRRTANGGWCDLCRQAQALPEACPSCGDTDFSGSSAGLELVRRGWTKQGLPDVEWRDGSPLALDAPLPARAAVLVTEPSLLGGAAEDIRRTERLCRAYRLLTGRVAEAGGELILQIHEEDTERWTAWLGPDGVRALNQAERAARTVFRYPPSVRLAKLLVDQPAERAEALGERLDQAFKNDAAFLERRGPFPVEGRPKSRPRFVMHLLFRPETSEQALVERLSPWARQAKIDLDAVAFLR